MFQFGLRLGDDPRYVVTTTPRPVKLVRDLLEGRTTHVTRGSTYDNRANLPPAFFESIIRKYEGTRLGRQELNAELLEDNPLALWRREAMLEAYRVTQPPDLKRIVVAVDPQAADVDSEELAETGIIVVGLGVDDHAYVLEDRSLRASPALWGREAVTAYQSRKADRLVAEVNNGGAMVKHVIQTADPTVAYRELHASRGKQTRAEPVAALYEQGRVHHVGTFPELEDQLCSWTPGDRSPDRLDALVWGVTELMLGEPAAVFGHLMPSLLTRFKAALARMTFGRSGGLGGSGGVVTFGDSWDYRFAHPDQYDYRKRSAPSTGTPSSPSASAGSPTTSPSPTSRSRRRTRKGSTRRWRTIRSRSCSRTRTPTTAGMSCGRGPRRTTASTATPTG